MRTLTLLLLLLAFPLWAADPPSPASVTLTPTKLDLDKDDGLVKVKASGKVAWTIPERSGVRVWELKDGGLLLTHGNPGVWDLVVYTSDASGPSAPAVCVVTVGRPPPSPEPQPEPPAPTPPVAVRKVWAVVVHDSRTNTEATSKLLANAALWKGLQVLGHGWAHYDLADRDQAAKATAKGYGPWVKQAGGPPCLLFIPLEGGAVLQAAKFPADVAGVEEAVRVVAEGK